jgi:hypothetical protein
MSGVNRSDAMRCGQWLHDPGRLGGRTTPWAPGSPPLKSRARWSDPQASERWQREHRPGVAAVARQRAQTCTPGTNRDFRAYTAHGKAWASTRKTSVIQRTGRSHSISAGPLRRTPRAGLLTCELPWRFERRAVRRVAREGDEGSQRAGAPRSRWTAGPQGGERARMHCVDPGPIATARRATQSPPCSTFFGSPSVAHILDCRVKAFARRICLPLWGGGPARMPRASSRVRTFLFALVLRC